MPEDRTYKIVIGIVISAVIAGIAVYGTYLPMRKAEVFIATLQSFQTSPASSLSDLETRIATPLDQVSPIGQEELVRNMANSILGFVQNSGDPTSTAELIGFLNKYYNPILDKGRGLSFGQDIYLEGAVNEIAFVKTGDPTYLTAATKWYALGNQLGPDRPQPLYGLFDVYRAANNVTGTIQVGQKILSDWPTDDRIAAALAQYIVPATSTATSTKKK